MEEIKFDVFISYSSEDKLVADAVCHTLEANQIKCWMAPRDVLPGTPYAKAIIQAIRESQIMVMVYSKNSNQSEHVANEIERMFHQGRPIIPFLIDETQMSEEYEYYLSRKHWLVAYPEYRAKCEELAIVIRRILGFDSKKADIITSADRIVESYKKGKNLYYAAKYIEALSTLQPAAEGGHADAQYFSGLICYLAYCGIVDYKKAAYWFERAARQDHVYAEEHLARLYEDGLGVQKDYKQALYWYSCSADHDNADALYSLGRMYEAGRGVDSSDEKAFHHYLKAASVGTVGNGSTIEAMKKVASMYEFGVGTDRDIPKAIKWNKKILILLDSEHSSTESQYREEIEQKIAELELAESKNDNSHSGVRMPVFIGEEPFSQWVSSHIQLQGLQWIPGTVKVKFTIGKDGTVKDVKVVQSVTADMDEEVVRVVLSSPKWIPAIQGNDKVEVSYTIPVIFE